MYDLWPPADYPNLTAPTPTVTGCTRNSTVSGLSTFTAQTPAVDAVTTRLIRPIFVKGQGGVLRWSVTVAPFVTNLVAANQASIETDTTGLGASGTVSISRETAYALHGSASLRCEVTSGTGAINAGIPAGTSSAVPVTAGQTYTYTLSLRPINTQYFRLYVVYRGADGTTYVDESMAPTTSCPDSTWTTLTYTHTAPAGAYYAHFWAYAETSTVGQRFNLDCLGLWPGTGGTWALPSGRIYDADNEMDVQAQIIFLDDDDAQVGRWTGQEYHIEAAIVLSARLPVPRLATQAQLKVLSLCDTNAGQWTEYDSRLEQIPADDPYTPPGVDATFGDMSPEGVAPPAPPAGLPGFEANSPARRSPQVRWCQVHDSVRPDLTPKKNAREV